MKISLKHQIKLAAVAAAVCCSVIAFGVPESQAKTVTGIDSSISVQTVGEMKADSVNVTIDKKLKKFVIGDQFNRTEEANMNVLIYTLSMRTKEFEAATGQPISSVLPTTIDSFTTSALRMYGATGVKSVKVPATIFKKPVEINTLDFYSSGQKMSAKVISFLDKDDLWIVAPVYYVNDKGAAEAADQFVKTLEIY